MQRINWLELQPRLADVNPLHTRLQDALIAVIQALCAADPRKVISRAEIFPLMSQGTGSSYSRHFLFMLTCVEAGNGRDIIP